MDIYNIPFYQKSKLKRSIRLIYILGAIFSLAFSLLFINFIRDDDYVLGLLFGMFFLILAIFLTYIYVTVDVLKIYYIELGRPDISGL